MIYLLLIFIVLPVIEISLFIQFGDALGTVNTILLIFLTAGIGVYLVRQQGFNTLRKMQQEIQNQELPVRSLFDGFVILISGILLLIPGFFTDSNWLHGIDPNHKIFYWQNINWLIH
jgi:UPF0716 protein FxsA